MGPRLHDYYFLPSGLWKDFESILKDLKRDGFKLNPETYREIWNWRCPKSLEFRAGGARLTVRKALEGWPLLCETPMEGGQYEPLRGYFDGTPGDAGNEAFKEKYRVLRPGPGSAAGASSARTRIWRGCDTGSTALHPSLHPGLPPHLPLRLCDRGRKSGKPVAAYKLAAGQPGVRRKRTRGKMKLSRRPCRKLREQSLTFDLRLS